MPDSHEQYAFTSFVLDSTERVLLRDGVEVSLRNKVFETLLFLVRNAGRLVSREELLQAIWPDTYVDEANLNQNVSEIRRALGDGNLIQTVPRQGFRFVALVTALAETRKPSLLRQRAVPLTVAAAVIIVAVVAGALASHRGRVNVESPSYVSVLPFRALDS